MRQLPKVIFTPLRGGENLLAASVLFPSDVSPKHCLGGFFTVKMQKIVFLHFRKSVFWPNRNSDESHRRKSVFDQMQKC